MIMFIAAHVTYPVLSVGKILLNGYTGVFAPTGCFTARRGCRIVVEQRGKTCIVEGRLGASRGVSKIGNQVVHGLGQEEAE